MKLRIVYDASANQIIESLHAGPSLLPEIFYILERFSTI